MRVERRDAVDLVAGDEAAPVRIRDQVEEGCATGADRPSQCRRTNLEAALRQVDGENVNVGHMLLLLRHDIAPL